MINVAYLRYVVCVNFTSVAINTHPLTHPPSHSLTHSPTHPLTHSLTYPPAHSLTYTHSPTHPLTICSATLWVNNNMNEFIQLLAHSLGHLLICFSVQLKRVPVTTLTGLHKLREQLKELVIERSQVSSLEVRKRGMYDGSYLPLPIACAGAMWRG